LLEKLVSRGTPSAAAEVARIADSLPHLNWIHLSRLRAEEQAFRTAWIPLTPSDFMTMCRAPGTALVRSGSELQAILVDALRSLDASLQGETPAGPELWNTPTGPTDKKTAIRPKSEEDLSDWLKRRLTEALVRLPIVAMREPEIRRGAGRGATRSKGERLDLHVVASVPGQEPGSFRKVSVIIEVKGCWHRDLKHAMRSQLRDRYMRDTAGGHGIYVVGWYMCDQWDDTDGRRHRTPPWSLVESRRHFEEQAGAASRPEASLRAVVLNTALR